MTSISDRLAELGLRLPAVKPPAANYVHNTRSQELLLLSGQIGSAGAATAGAVGAGLSAESAVQEAHVAALGLLAALDAAVDGDADRIEQVLRLGVFIAAIPTSPATARWPTVLRICWSPYLDAGTAAFGAMFAALLRPRPLLHIEWVRRGRCAVSVEGCTFLSACAVTDETRPPSSDARIARSADRAPSD
jgi:enamine deaminase RidA (YjgF/YER057c/UK114 family)